MKTGRVLRSMLVLGLLSLVLAGCGKKTETVEAPAVEEKVEAVTPAAPATTAPEVKSDPAAQKPMDHPAH